MGRWAVAALLLLLVAFELPAQSTSGDLRETVEGTIGIEKETQAERDAWAEEQAELEARYRTASANVRYLTDRIAIEEDRLGALEESVAELERRLYESGVLQASLQDTLDATMARFIEFVEADLPFLEDERERRVEVLRHDLSRPDVDGSEKLRRLLEAMQVETEYGKAVEVNQQEIDLKGEAVFVDVLRVGRVSLFWRTPDGEKVGSFDQAGWKWVELPRKYTRPITEAIEMASRLRPVQLTALPLGRIER